MSTTEEKQTEKPAEKLTLKKLFDRTDVRSKFEEMLGKRASSFITSVLQAAASNDMLKDADPLSIYNAASVAATLDLPINNSLSFSYIVPFKDTKNNRTLAQFIIGYR